MLTITSIDWRSLIFDLTSHFQDGGRGHWRDCMSTARLSFLATSVALASVKTILEVSSLHSRYNKWFKYLRNGARYDQGYYDGLRGSSMRAFDWYQNQRPGRPWTAYPGTAQSFIKVPAILSKERVKLRTSNLAGTFTGSIRTKAIKNFGEKGAWAYPGAAQIFLVPPIISETGKATDFKFGR